MIGMVRPLALTSYWAWMWFRAVRGAFVLRQTLPFRMDVLCFFGVQVLVSMDRRDVGLSSLRSLFVHGECCNVVLDQGWLAMDLGVIPLDRHETLVLCVWNFCRVFQSGRAMSCSRTVQDRTSACPDIRLHALQSPVASPASERFAPWGNPSSLTIQLTRPQGVMVPVAVYLLTAAADVRDEKAGSSFFTYYGGVHPEDLTYFSTATGAVCG